MKQKITATILKKFIGILVQKYTNILYWVAMAGIIFWLAYSKGWIMANFEFITPKQAQTLLENDQNVTLLDVRTIEEFKTGHLRDAQLIPLSVLEKNLDKIDKSKKVIVYCKSGNRSVSASRILEKNGFVPLNVKNGIVGLMGVKMEIVK